MGDLFKYCCVFCILFFSFISCSGVSGEAGSGGNGAAPIPPQEIPLAGTITHLVDIPYASGPIMSSSIEEIYTSDNGELSLNYFLMDSNPIATAFTSGTSEAMCVYATAYAKAIAFISESGDHMMCSIKLLQNALEDNMENFYESGKENIFSFTVGSQLIKIKMIFDSLGAGDEVVNINGFDLFICKGTSEADLTQTQYTHYERLPRDATNDSLIVNLKKKDDNGNIQSANMYGRINALLQLVDKKLIEFSWYNTWSADGGGSDQANFTLLQGYNNLSMSGYGRNVTTEGRSTWQLSGVGGVFQGDLEAYSFKEIDLGNVAMNYAKDAASAARIYVDGTTLQEEDSPNEFYNSLLIGMPPRFTSIVSVNFRNEESWDCGGEAVAINFAPYLEDSVNECAVYYTNNLYDPFYCASIETDSEERESEEEDEPRPTPTPTPTPTPRNGR